MMPEEEVGRRKDLRNAHLVFSIDPIGCEDVDDTLSVRYADHQHALRHVHVPSSPLGTYALTSPSSPLRHLKNGVTELGVHIADVSYFVPPGSLTDLEARERSTTIYLADRRYDMLPLILSADLCSLLSNVDR